MHAFRLLRKHPGFSAVAILTIALGIGANATIFSFVHALLLQPLPFPDPDRLVRIQAMRGGEAGKLMVREWEELEREPELFQSVAGYYLSQYNMAEGGPPVAARATMTTASLFRVLGAAFVLGGPWSEAAHRVRTPVTVLDHSVWRQRFGGDPAIVGKTVLLDAAPYQVAGVTAPGFEFPARQELYRAAWLYHDQNRFSRCLFAIARLAPGVPEAEAQSRLVAFGARMEREFPETNRGIGFRVSPLRDQVVGNVRPYLLLTWLLVGAVLLIACVNLGNLLLARAVACSREVAVRLALGAGRGRIVRQMFAEALVLSLCGAIAGVLLSIPAVHLIREWLPLQLPAWIRIEPGLTVVFFAAALAVFTALFTAAIPAFFSGGLNEFARGSSSGRRQQLARNLLMSGELALCAALLIVAGLLLRSFWQLLDTDIGFNRESMLTLHVDPPFSRYSKPEQTALFYQEVQRRLSALPGVRNVAANHSLPFAGNDNYGNPAVVLEGQSEEDQLRNPFMNVQVVSPNYLDMIGIPLRTGRRFDGRDRVDTTPVAILSRALVRRLYGDADAIGRRFRFIGLLGSTDKKQDAWFTVIGIAGNARTQGLLLPPSMDVYLSNQQQFVGDTYFLLRTGQDPASLAPIVPKVFEQIDSEQAIFDISTMEARIEYSVWHRRLAGALSLGFGVIALILASVGAYGVISYSVAQRTREVGIRLALGATSSSVVRMVVGQGLRIALAGLAVGATAAAALGSAIRPMLHGVHFLDPLTFTLVAGALVVVSVVACYLPARRAGKVDPLIALRQD